METITEIFTLELGENFFNHLKFHFIVVFFFYFIPPILADGKDARREDTQPQVAEVS